MKMRRGPETIGNILPELMARRGYARLQGAEQYAAAWAEAAGPLAAQYTRAGNLRCGKLEVVVANSTLMQELGFQKAGLLQSLARLLPDQGIKDLRFRLGVIQ
jgi:predicted nucleic acid-binding Zn ribbon protein